MVSATHSAPEAFFHVYSHFERMCMLQMLSVAGNNVETGAAAQLLKIDVSTPATMYWEEFFALRAQCLESLQQGRAHRKLELFARPVAPTLEGVVHVPPETVKPQVFEQLPQDGVEMHRAASFLTASPRGRPWTRMSVSCSDRSTGEHRASQTAGHGVCLEAGPARHHPALQLAAPGTRGIAR